jgi:DNA polymerase III epsilon subunit family exonuclease
MDRVELLKKLNLSQFTAFDFETTGLNAASDRIIEIAAIRFINGKPTDNYVKLIHPDRPIPPFITEITGISNSMVMDAPREEDIVDDFFDFLGNDPLIAHNIRFDHQFLDNMSERFDKPKLKNKLYDSLQLAYLQKVLIVRKKIQKIVESSF